MWHVGAVWVLLLSGTIHFHRGSALRAVIGQSKYKDIGLMFTNGVLSLMPCSNHIINAGLAFSEGRCL